MSEISKENILKKIANKEMPSHKEVIDSLFKANMILSKFIGGLYAECVQHLVDEEKEEKLDRRKLIRAQQMLLGVITDCQFHDTDCVCGHCIDEDEDEDEE